MRKKNKTAWIRSIILLICIISFVGCQNKPKEQEDDIKDPEAGEESNPNEELEAGVSAEEVNTYKYTIDMIAKGTEQNYWKTVEIGAKKAGEEEGVKVNFVAPKVENDIQEQQNLIKNSIKTKKDAICLAAADTSQLIEQLKNAMYDHIPVIGFDSGVPEAPDGSVLANVETDNYKAGQMAADYLYEKIREKADTATGTAPIRIGVVPMEEKSRCMEERTRGFIDKIVELAGGENVSVEGADKFKKAVENAKVIIEAQIPASMTEEAGKEIFTDMMSKTDLVGIFATNEYLVNQMLEVNIQLNILGEGKITGIGFDSGAAQQKAIKERVLYGSVTQDPIAMGYYSVKLATAAADGMQIEHKNTDAYWYNADNIEDETIAPCLYE